MRAEVHLVREGAAVGGSGDGERVVDGQAFGDEREVSYGEAAIHEEEDARRERPKAL